MPEAGERARLFNEAGQPPLEVLPVRGRFRMHRHTLAHGELVGQVLLHRHPVAQADVLAQIGDAEAANAQHLEQAVVAQLMAGRQGLLVFEVRHGQTPNTASNRLAIICCPQRRPCTAPARPLP